LFLSRFFCPFCPCCVFSLLRLGRQTFVQPYSGSFFHASLFSFSPALLSRIATLQAVSAFSPPPYFGVFCFEGIAPKPTHPFVFVGCAPPLFVISDTTCSPPRFREFVFSFWFGLCVPSSGILPAGAFTGIVTRFLSSPCHFFSPRFLTHFGLDCGWLSNFLSLVHPPVFFGFLSLFNFRSSFFFCRQTKLCAFFFAKPGFPSPLVAASFFGHSFPSLLMSCFLSILFVCQFRSDWLFSRRSPFLFLLILSS